MDRPTNTGIFGNHWILTTNVAKLNLQNQLVLKN